MSYLAQPSMEPQKSCPFSEASSPVHASNLEQGGVKFPIAVLSLLH